MGSSEELSKRGSRRDKQTAEEKVRALPRIRQATSQSRKAFSLFGGAGGKRGGLLRYRVSNEPRKDLAEVSQTQRV